MAKKIVIELEIEEGKAIKDLDAVKKGFEKVIDEQEKQVEAKVQEELEKRLSGMPQPAVASEEAVANVEEANSQALEETVEDVVENVEVPHSSIANNNEASSVEESLSDKFKKAFNSENISITY